LEQPLPKNFSCNLGSLNLNEFILNPFTENAEFNYDDFKKSIYIAVEALDYIIDENADNHPLEVQKINSLNYRNIGLGIMGFANCLMKLGIRYGSQESKDFTNKLFAELFKTAMLASNKLAKEKGAFPKYKDIIFESTIIKKHFSVKEIEELKIYGLRNCSLISIAPTGSIATMFNISGGCEPEFAIKYTRRTENLNDGKDKYYDVYCRTLKEYQNYTKQNNIPDFFVSSSDINWKDRIDIQGIMQEHVDTAISSTVNLPKNITINDVEQLYLHAWKQGLKGVTIYRSGCNREGILNTDSQPKETEFRFDYIEPISKDELGETLGTNKKEKVACGSLFVSINREPLTGNICETYVNTSKSGVCPANIAAVSRLTSLCLRSGVKVQAICDELIGIKCGACSILKSQGKDINISCPDAIGKYLKEKYQQGTTIITEKIQKKKKQITKEDNMKCPNCGEQMRMEGGCTICQCGFSKCG
jgi:ribonucleoside-diphosphate reductase alpha chain